MCGIVGIWQTNNEPVDEEVLIRMRDRLISRGPDDAGIWINKNVGLGHRRLSILDLSQLGHQPMVDEATGSVITYNGEVYNFREIRKELQAKGVSFTSQTDTEVVLKAYRVWGTACLDRFVGMFAFAIWDKNKQKLFIARDRLGIKPLYYFIGKDVILFSSRLKALLAHAGCPREIDPEALGLYLDLGFVPSPWSILSGIRKLQPGHLLLIDSQNIDDQCYWSPDNVTIDNSLVNIDEHELVDRLENLLEDSIKSRMISDVPLGAFLSGGIDSSLVTAIMTKYSSSPIKTFTIGFGENRYNETDYAKKISHVLKTDYYEKVMKTDDLIGLLDDINEHYDEPFADSSNLPTMMVSRFARQHVTVCLSGDGGDELFAGYPQYRILSRLQGVFRLPKCVRVGCGRMLSKINHHRLSMLGHSLCKNDLLASFSYVRSISKGYCRQNLFNRNGQNVEQLFNNRSATFPEMDDISKMSRLDISYYLSDGILQKVDVASMSTSLEVRVPILDHRVVEFANSLPISLKLRYGKGKYLLRKVLNRHVPNRFFNRPKSGFSVPLNEWFRSELKEMLLDGLSSSRVKEFDLINPEAVKNLVDIHLSGKRNMSPILWALLCLLNWNEQLKKS